MHRAQRSAFSCRVLQLQAELESLGFCTAGIFMKPRPPGYSAFVSHFLLTTARQWEQTERFYKEAKSNSVTIAPQCFRCKIRRLYVTFAKHRGVHLSFVLQNNTMWYFKCAVSRLRTDMLLKIYLFTKIIISKGFQITLGFMTFQQTMASYFFYLVI